MKCPLCKDEIIARTIGTRCLNLACACYGMGDEARSQITSALAAARREGAEQMRERAAFKVRWSALISAGNAAALADQIRTLEPDGPR